MNAPTILFAAGRGGSPDRHTATLDRFRDAGLSTVAPAFPMIASLRPTAEELLGRAETLMAALDEADPARAVVGVGHSIGATILLAMAGAQIWLAPGQRLAIPEDSRITKIVALAPPVDFFGGSGALDCLAVPVFLRSGGRDTITPPDMHQRFAQELSRRLPVDFATAPGAGHFSFMDTPPPGLDDPMPEGEAFRARLAEAIVSFVAAA